MNRNSVKVMIYSYFLNLKSYINTYISATYTESIVSNIKPKGNHNYIRLACQRFITVRNVKPKGNHNNYDIAREVMKTVSNIKPKGNSKGFNSTPLYKKIKKYTKSFSRKFY